jgi:hypothetical protein
LISSAVILNSFRAVDYSILFFASFAVKYLTARDAKVSQRALSFIYYSFLNNTVSVIFLLLYPDRAFLSQDEVERMIATHIENEKSNRQRIFSCFAVSQGFRILMFLL